MQTDTLLAARFERLLALYRTTEDLIIPLDKELQEFSSTRGASQLTNGLKPRVIQNCDAPAVGQPRGSYKKNRFRERAP